MILAQQPPIMEMLCHNMSDDTGGALVEFVQCSFTFKGSFF